MSNSNEQQIKFANEELFGKGKLDIIDEVFSKNYVVHAGNKEYKGCEFIRKFTRQLRFAIPDIQVNGFSLFSQTNNSITWQRTLSGKHVANMMGIPPSGKKIQWQDMVVTHFEDGKIAEEWTVSELAGQLLLKLS